MDRVQLDGPVTVVPYDPNWPLLFEQERDRLTRALGVLEVSVEHVGSTAVPGLAAKPIVDLLVGTQVEVLREARGLLAAAGYEDVVRYFRRRFRGDFNVTLTGYGSVDWHREILFRDYLRSHPESARRYEQLKIRTANRVHGHAAYAGEKRGLIQELLEEAAHWRKGG